MPTPLRDMEAELRSLADADGNSWPVLWFRCPKCKDTDMPHMNMIPHSLTGTEKPRGLGLVWQHVSGTTIDDITLNPSYRVVRPCGLHGWVCNGHWHEA
jgi:hypothetical protein